MHPAWPSSFSFCADAGTSGAAAFRAPSTGTAEDFFLGDNGLSLAVGMQRRFGLTVETWLSILTGRLREGHGELSLYELGLWYAVRVAENQMVLL